MAKAMISEYIAPKQHFECEMCGKKKVQGQYKYKAHQYIPDYEPVTMIICKNCIYKEIYGSKNRAKMMKTNIIEKQSAQK